VVICETISLTNDHGYVPFVVFTSFSQMTTYMLPLSYSQFGPFLIQDLSPGL